MWFYLVLIALLGFSFGFHNPTIMRWFRTKFRYVVADTLADIVHHFSGSGWLWRLWPLRLKAWLFLNADLDTIDHSLFRFFRR